MRLIQVADFSDYYRFIFIEEGKRNEYMHIIESKKNFDLIGSVYPINEKEIIFFKNEIRKLRIRVTTGQIDVFVTTEDFRNSWEEKKKSLKFYQRID